MSRIMALRNADGGLIEGTKHEERVPDCEACGCVPVGENFFDAQSVRAAVISTVAQSMPADSAARKGVPLASGVLDYFPAALAAVARLSKLGNDKHNPGEPLHWERGKSQDHADCIARHLVDRGIVDAETGMSHTVEVAWRALALLQEELEAAGAPRARGAW